VDDEQIMHDHSLIEVEEIVAPSDHFLLYIVEGVA
jgi:hypothetical protein